MVTFRPADRLPFPHNFAESVAAAIRRDLEHGALQYEADPPDCDRWCSPARTLARGKGDCDDLAILAASILRAGLTSAAVVTGHYCGRDGCIGHAWVEGADERGWFLLEATNGSLFRVARPETYQAQLILELGRCVMKP